MRPFRFFVLVFGGCLGALAATNAIDPAALSYNLTTTVQAYDSVGRKDPRWDADVRECLRLYARFISITNPSVVEDGIRDLKNALPKATAAGCNDALFQFLRLEYLQAGGLATNEVPVKAAECANALDKTSYPEIRKYYAAIYVRDCLRFTGDRQNQSSNWAATATQHLAKAMADRSVPAWLADRYINTLWSGCGPADGAVWASYRLLEASLDRYWSNAPFALLAKGRGNLSRAWVARGLGLPGEVSPDSWREMFRYLAIASQSFQSAWSLDPRDIRSCAGMMQVEMLAGQGEPILDRWFLRGMELDPSNFDLCSIKLNYLRPRWHGSTGEMIAFGRMCTANTNWGGAVRLMLAFAHEAVAGDLPDDESRREYWLRSQVWDDIHSTFEQFFKLYPQSVEFRHNYARYAIACGKYTEFLDQVKQFPSTNFAYFGGEAQFRELVNLAKSKANQP